MKIFILIVTYLLSMTLGLFARDEVKIVGSSTVYPFATIIAENFSRKNPNYKSPVVESTGTGGGIKLFCDGVGVNYPDVVNASRKIKKEEIAECNKHGVLDIKEISIGYDVIVMVHSKALKSVNLTTKQIFLAVAAEVPDINGSLIKNPYKNWNEIDNSLPNVPIKVMGPPSTSGTRDSFVELVLEKGCKELQKEKPFKDVKSNKSDTCKAIREDGAWINGGENDLLLISKVAESKDTFAILGYSFYQQNQNTVLAAQINGISPSGESLKNKSYPLFRPLFMYVKGEHLYVIPGLLDFVKETISVKAIGENGYLIKKGMISLDQKEYSAMVKNLNLK